MGGLTISREWMGGWGGGMEHGQAGGVRGRSVVGMKMNKKKENL